MSNMLLAKPKLQHGFIDTSVGEPYLVRDNLIKIFQLEEEFKIGHFTSEDLSYPSPTGYEPLVKFLEDKHQAPVIITNGAKQALGAVFYALNKLGKEYIAMKSPYWALIPPLVKMHGLESTFAEPNVESEDPFLLLAPNNPDGQCASAKELIELSLQYKDANVPFIHDAAYYTHIYLPESHLLPSIGDVQIFSISKMLGLSGLRLGYAVCHNPEYYKLIQEYVEGMTVGVSISSQSWLYDLLDRRMRSFPTLVEKFESISSMQLESNKKLCLQIDSEKLEIPSNVASTYGMFGWFKAGPKLNLAKAKVNCIDGSLFGMPGFIRMNLAFKPDKMQEIINRINNTKE